MIRESPWFPVAVGRAAWEEGGRRFKNSWSCRWARLLSTGARFCTKVRDPLFALGTSLALASLDGMWYFSVPLSMRSLRHDRSTQTVLSNAHQTQLQLPKLPPNHLKASIREADLILTPARAATSLHPTRSANKDPNRRDDPVPAEHRRPPRQAQRLLPRPGKDSPRFSHDP